MLKRFEKLQYMVIGALLMAVGIGIGSIFTSPLAAQRNDVFDEITCRKLTVIDKNGETAISLASDQDKNNITLNNITLFDDKGDKAFYIVSNPKTNVLGIHNRNSKTDGPQVALLSSNEESGVFVYNDEGKGAVSMSHTPEDNSVVILDRETTEFAVTMASTQDGNGLTVHNDEGKDAIYIASHPEINVLNVYDVENDERAIMILSSPAENAISFFDIGDEKAVLSMGFTPEKCGMSIFNRDGNTHFATLGRFMNHNRFFLTDENGNPATLLHGKSGDNFLGVYDASGELHKYSGLEPITLEDIPLDPE